jgi:hypothetical protein
MMSQRSAQPDGDSTVDLDALARAIVARGFREPAIFLLEACKPLRGVVHEVVVGCEPLLRLFCPAHIPAQLRELLSSAEGVERLLHQLEQ